MAVQPVLAGVVRRARADPVRAVLAKAGELGVRFRFRRRHPGDRRRGRASSR